MCDLLLHESYFYYTYGVLALFVKNGESVLNVEASVGWGRSLRSTRLLTAVFEEAIVERQYSPRPAKSRCPTGLAAQSGSFGPRPVPASLAGGPPLKGKIWENPQDRTRFPRLEGAETSHDRDLNEHPTKQQMAVSVFRLKSAPT